MAKKPKICKRCGGEHWGSLMRYDIRYTRVLKIITAPEVPRHRDGSIALCHLCQRATAFAGSFTRLLLRDLNKTVLFARIQRNATRVAAQKSQVNAP